MLSLDTIKIYSFLALYVTISWRKHTFSCLLKSWIKGFDTQPPGPWSIVEMKASGKLCGSQRAAVRGMHHMVKSCYTAADPPIKARCFCLFRLQREYWSVWKTTQSSAAVFAKRLWAAGIHLCVAETLSGILQKHVHVNKQDAGREPELSFLLNGFARGGCA